MINCAKKKPEFQGETIITVGDNSNLFKKNFLTPNSTDRKIPLANSKVQLTTSIEFKWSIIFIKYIVGYQNGEQR